MLDLKVPSKADIISMLLSLAGVCLCYANGLGITYDSELYLNGSAFLKNNGFTEIMSIGVFQAKPPLFVFWIYILSENLILIGTFSAIFLLGSLWLTFQIIEGLNLDNKLMLPLKLVISLGTPVFLIHEFLLPEPIYFFFWNLHLFLVWKIMKSADKQLFVTLIICTILMIGLRHIAVVPLAITSLFLLYRHHNSEFRFFAMSHLVIPGAVFLIWQYLVYQSRGNFDRIDHLAGLDIFDNISEISHWLCKWFLPLTDYFLFDLALQLAVLAGLALLMINSIKNKEYLLFLLSHELVFLVLIKTKGDLLSSDVERYLAMIFIPLFISIFIGIQNLCISRKWSIPTITPFIYIWMLYPLFRSMKAILFWGGFID